MALIAAASLTLPPKPLILAPKPLILSGVEGRAAFSRPSLDISAW